MTILNFKMVIGTRDSQVNQGWIRIINNSKLNIIKYRSFIVHLLGSLTYNMENKLNKLQINYISSQGGSIPYIHYVRTALGLSTCFSWRLCFTSGLHLKHQRSFWDNHLRLNPDKVVGWWKWGQYQSITPYNKPKYSKWWVKFSNAFKIARVI